MKMGRLVTGSTTSISDTEFTGLVGVARFDITPPIGIYSRNWGSAKFDTKDGVHRPLYAYALALADGERTNIILTLDLMTWCSREDEFGIREPLLQAFNLDESQLMMHISHNHAAPLTDLIFANKTGGEFIAPYRLFLIETLSKCIAAAIDGLSPCSLSWHKTTCQLAYNRDFPEPSSGQIICGINPDAQADDVVMVGRITDTQGQIKAVLVNYACHPTTLGGGNRKFSPDYPGAMRALIEDTHQGALCLFLHGASGDLAPRQTYVADTEIADKNGRELGYAALGALEAMLPPQKSLTYAGTESSGTTLGIWELQGQILAPCIKATQSSISLEVKSVPPVEVLQAQKQNETDRAAIERLDRAIMVSHFIAGRDSLPLQFWVWKIGSTIFVATPTEMHSEFQIKLRAAHPDLSIIVLNIVNGYTSYLPPKEDYPSNSYQVQVSIFKAGAAEAVFAAVNAQIESIKQ